MKTGKMALLSLILLFFAVIIKAQPTLTTPELSQAATISQTIGLTKITVDYHRPLVKERKIWGGLVPYNQVWRAGANENTIIEFSDPVKINGMEIPAGKYGFHAIPGENEWTLIFNKNSDAWGSFFYDNDLDALRINVKPQTANFTEALTYSFDDPKPGSVVVSLTWEKLKIPFTVEVDVNKVVVDNMKKELTGLAGFYSDDYLQAANYCLQNAYDIEQGLNWVDESIKRGKSFGNLYTKSEILMKMGKGDEAKKIKEEAMELATENDLNKLGNQYNSSENYEGAIKIFNMNLELHPNSLRAYLGLGNAYSELSNYKLAIENYEKAKEITPNQGLKERLQKAIDDLMKK